MTSNAPQYVTGGNVIAHNAPMPTVSIKVPPRTPNLIFNITAILGSITGVISFIIIPICVVAELFPASALTLVEIIWGINLSLLVLALVGNFWVDYRYGISS